MDISWMECAKFVAQAYPMSQPIVDTAIIIPAFLVILMSLVSKDVLCVNNHKA